MCIQIDSQSLDIQVSCQVTLSVHHFSKDIQINMNSNEKIYSPPVTRLIQSCNDGTLATVKFLIKTCIAFAFLQCLAGVRRKFMSQFLDCIA